MQLLNLQSEYNSLRQVMVQFFNGSDFPEFDTFLKDVFNMGLKQAQFWAEEGIISECLVASGKSSTRHSMIEDREEFLDKTHSIASFFDAFCLFENHLRYGLLSLHRGEEFNFDYTQSARDIAALMLSKYPSKNLMALLPKSSHEVNKKEQKRLCAEFSGYKHRFASYSLADNLSPNVINYYQNDQKTYFIEKIVNFAFNHALTCMKYNNTASMVNLMVSLHEKHNTAPFDAENGQDIVSIASKHPVINAILAIKPVKFSNNTLYQEEVERIATFQAKRKLETPEEKATREENSISGVDFLNKLLNKTPEEESIKKQKDSEELTHLKSVIKQLKTDITSEQI